MLKTLRLERFKNFETAELQLGPLTLLVGTNASGKSNIRDAFRFLHGISRGYNLAEIIGEKWGEGGELQWRGIRGGTKEAPFPGESVFAIETEMSVQDDGSERNASYRIKVDVGRNGKPPRIVEEHLRIKGRGKFVFDSHPDGVASLPMDDFHIAVRLTKKGQSGFIGRTLNFTNSRPVLHQVLDHPEVKPPAVKELSRLAMGSLTSMRFLDLNPEAMRNPSLPGQTNLGDQGQNLSAVLQAICEDESKKRALVEWLKALTPMDAKDFEFPQDQAGRVLVTLVEASGQRISAYSASDGTLRFLAMIAALLGPEPARFYFFEELDNGIHPARLHLLLQLIEQRVGAAGIQMVATTHSPQLLGLLSPQSREYASLVYRLPDARDARIRRVLDIPNAREALEKKSWADLHQSGWLENAVYFGESERDG